MEREKRGREWGKKSEGGHLGLPVISLMALWSSHLDNKLCTAISAGLKILAMRNDGCLGDPCKFAWVQNNCGCQLLKLLSLSLLSPRRGGPGWRGTDCLGESQHLPLVLPGV